MNEVQKTFLKNLILFTPNHKRASIRVLFSLRTMYRGTTPTYTFIAPNTVDLSTATKIWVTFSTMDETELFSKVSGDIVLSDTHTIQVYLTQEETLSFPTGSVKAQVNWIYQEGTKTKRACSEKMIINAKTNLKDVVLNG